MGIIWGYRTYKRMPWTIRQAASETICISPYMYERKVSEALEINKLKTINEKDKTFTVLYRDRGCLSGIASSYFFRPSKVTEYVTSRFSRGEFKTE